MVENIMLLLLLLLVGTKLWQGPVLGRPACYKCCVHMRFCTLCTLVEKSTDKNSVEFFLL